MKYCLKKKEKFVTIKCGNGVQLAYSKKYTPAVVISFLQLRNYHVTDCILRQKMTNIELWGSLEEGHPKKASYKLIHPDFIEWWSKVQKSGGTEPAIPPIFYEDPKPAETKTESKGTDSDAEHLEIVLEEPIELEKPYGFMFDDIGAGNSTTNRLDSVSKNRDWSEKQKVRDKILRDETVKLSGMISNEETDGSNVEVVAKPNGYRRDNVRPGRPSQLVRLRTGGENNSVPAHLGMKSSPDVSEECKKKHANLQTVIDAANFADADGNIGMAESIELVSNEELTERPPKTDYINAYEVLKSLYNVEERIKLQKESVLYRSQRVSRGLTDCFHFESLIGLTDTESKLKMEALIHGLLVARSLLKKEYSELETLEMRITGKNVDTVFDQLETRGYKPREFVNMFETGKIPDFETWYNSL